MCSLAVLADLVSAALSCARTAREQALHSRYMSGWTDNQTIINSTFANFKAPSLVPFSPCARCRVPGLHSGGLRFMRSSGLSLLGEGILVGYHHDSDGIITDADGSLLGVPGEPDRYSF